jgi:hypothetical protein
MGLTTSGAYLRFCCRFPHMEPTQRLRALLLLMRRCQLPRRHVVFAKAAFDLGHTISLLCQSDKSIDASQSRALLNSSSAL